jgi:hypothetical protein
MNEHTRVALKMALDETIKKRDDLKIMAEQYRNRAQVIENIEVEELNEKIR